MKAQNIHPSRSVILGFSSVIVIGSAILFLPVSHQNHAETSMIDCLFTAVSATTVTGLATVDTPTFWTPFGQFIILCLIQIGGLGVMTLSTAIGAFLLGRISLHTKLKTSAEVRSAGIFNMRRTILNILKISLTIEATGALLLFLRFFLGYHYSLGQALWQGIFHAISSFNNAGFALYSDNLVSFSDDPFILLPISFLIIFGGLGFPVIIELRKRWSTPNFWHMGTKIVLVGTPLLLLAGTLAILGLEFNNPATLGQMNLAEKLLNSFAQSASTRTAGFNNVDISAFHPATLLCLDLLMFIGGGPAGTAGGIKITTFAVLCFIVLTEIRGGVAVNVFGKRLSRTAHREAITVIMLSTTLVLFCILALMLITDFTTDQVIFEVISAFATVGLSTGITPHLPLAAKLILIVVMLVGRVGPITAVAAFAIRRRPVLYELPKERPIIG